MMDFFIRGERLYTFIVRELLKDRFERLALKVENLAGPIGNIGDESYLGGQVVLDETSFIGARSFLKGNIVIEEKCYLSPGCTIVGDITIGKNSFIEGGAVVSANVPPNSHVCSYGEVSKLKRRFEPYNPIAFHEMHKSKTTQIEDYFGHMLNLGKNVSFGEQIYVEGGSGIRIGDNSMLGPRCNFAASHHSYDQNQALIRSEERWDDIVIGKNVVIGANSIIRGKVVIGDGAQVAPGSVVVRDIPPNTFVAGAPAKPNLKRSTAPSVFFPPISNYFAVIGHMYAPVDYFNCFDSVNIEYTALINKEMLVVGDGGLSIRKGAMIAPRVNFITESPLFKKNVLVGEHSWIGSGATVLPGVIIGKGAIVGAGAVVDRDVPPNEIWAGKPIRKIGERFSK